MEKGETIDYTTDSYGKKIKIKYKNKDKYSIQTAPFASKTFVKFKVGKKVQTVKKVPEINLEFQDFESEEKKV